MTVSINLKNKTYKVQTILWDRDSFFVDPENYWSRLVASIAQRIAEQTTDNWNKFNLVRTRVIKSLGINPETHKVSNSAPILLLPVNCFSTMLASELSDLLSEKSAEELSLIFYKQIEQAIKECSIFIANATNNDNIALTQNLSGKVIQILITNDSELNNNTLLKATNTQNIFSKALTQLNKLNLDSLINSNAYLITSNSFLEKIYLEKGIPNIIVVKKLSELSFEESNDNFQVTVNIDGASKGNPGPAGIGIAFYQNGTLIKEIAENIGNTTNNFAEYTALIRALEISLESGFNNIEIRSDSELVVKQIKKIYKVKDADIKELYDKATSLISKLPHVEIYHVKREENLKADKLANKGIKSA